MKILAIIVSILFFASCSPVKKVLKNKKDFEAIGQVWAMQNPCVTDTVVSYKADTIINEKMQVDTLLLPADTLTVNNNYHTQKVIVKTFTKTVLIHDTAKIIVQDVRALNALRQQLLQSQKDATDFERKAKIRLWMLGALAALLLLIIIIKLK
jgi:hypothetical protein